MNATLMARNAYATASAPTRTPRSTEYEAFARITRRLTEDHARANYPDHVSALHENRQLWTILAMDVADQNNALPADLRARIFYLAEFTLTHTSDVLAGKASAAALIDINTAIMRGLGANGGS